MHAEVVIDGRDRKRLEHVLRYMARPSLALDRLEQRSDGYVIYRFKRAWRDGTHAVVLSPDDFIARLCALVPPPRLHLLRYFGVLAANAALRAEVVPKKPTAPPVQLPLFDECDAPLPAAKGAANKMAKPSRHPWAWLLRRVFAADVLVCVRCGGAMQLVKIAPPPDDIASVLRSHDLPREPPTVERGVQVHAQLRLRFV